MALPGFVLGISPKLIVRTNDGFATNLRADDAQMFGVVINPKFLVGRDREMDQ